MAITLSTQPASQISADWLILGVCEQGEFSPSVRRLDEALDGALSRVRQRTDLTGKLGELTILPDAPGIEAVRVMVVGLGEAGSLTLARLNQALLTATRKAALTKEATLALLPPEEAVEQLGWERTVQVLADAATVGGVGQGLYKSEPDKTPFRQIYLCTESVTDEEAGNDPQSAWKQSVQRGKILGEAVNLTRELVNRHAGEIFPDSFAERAAAEAAKLGIHGEIFEQHRIEQERMGALLAVARGSVNEPRVVVLEYAGGGEQAPWLALCGKGVTFDSGGLSIKPSDGMVSMKADMAGAATVLGAMCAIARLKLPVNILGLMGLVENMPSANAYRLGDVLTARNGVTIEVHNTDAEGRLVLADLLCYAVDRKADRIIDLATLTGSCVVALGEEVTGVFSNDQPWCDDVLAAARRAGEDAWQLPTFDSYAEQLKCDFADIKNVGTRWGGAITAAKFLERFVEKTPWVHLDIAGPSYAESAKPHRDPGGTGAMVRTLVATAEALM
jgi:leucyl aminopeptidase